MDKDVYVTYDKSYANIFYKLKGRFSYTNASFSLNRVSLGALITSYNGETSLHLKLCIHVKIT